MSNRVALIGAGAMGGAIGTRLAETGNRLTVFDPSPDKVQALVDKGAFAAASNTPTQYQPDPALKTETVPQLRARVSQACTIIQAKLQSGVSEASLSRPCSETAVAW